MTIEKFKKIRVWVLLILGIGFVLYSFSMFRKLSNENKLHPISEVETLPDEYLGLFKPGLVAKLQSEHTYLSNSRSPIGTAKLNSNSFYITKIELMDSVKTDYLQKLSGKSESKLGVSIPFNSEQISVQYPSQSNEKSSGLLLRSSIDNAATILMNGPSSICYRVNLGGCELLSTNKVHPEILVENRRLAGNVIINMLFIRKQNVVFVIVMDNVDNKQISSDTIISLFNIS